MSIRNEICTELAIRGRSFYWLAEMAAGLGIASKRSVYYYMSGKMDIGSEKAGMLLESIRETDNHIAYVRKMV